MSPTTKVRLIGLFAFGVAVGGTVYNWYSALSQGVYWPMVSFLFPFFACLGLSVMLYPMSKAEALAKYGSEQLAWRHMPLGQKTLVLLGVALGALQWALFSGHISL